VSKAAGVATKAPMLAGGVATLTTTLALLGALVPPGPVQVSVYT
jgi:hypothetical protein